MRAGRHRRTSRGVPPAQPAINRHHTFVWAPLCRATVATAQGEAVRNRGENKQQQEEPEGWSQFANMWQDASSFLDKPLRPFQGVWHPGDNCSQGWMAAEERAGGQRPTWGPGGSRSAVLGWRENTVPEQGEKADLSESSSQGTSHCGHIMSSQGTSPHSFCCGLWSCSQQHSLSHLNPWSQESQGLHSEYWLLFREKWIKKKRCFWSLQLQRKP